MSEAPQGWLSWRITLWGGPTDGWTPRCLSTGWAPSHCSSAVFQKAALSAHRVINKFLHPIQSNFLAFVVYREAQKNTSAPDSCPQVSLRRAPNRHFSLKKSHGFSGESHFSAEPHLRLLKLPPVMSLMSSAKRGLNLEML